MTRRGESCGPSPGSIARSKERLLILDVDEVVLHFIEPFEELLAEYGARLHPESFRLTGNVRSISTSAAISGHEIDGVTARLYDEQEVRQRPVEGVADALSRLAQHADIVFLTAMTPAFFDRRRRLLDREGLHYPMIATTRSKGSLVAELVEGWKGPAVFVDDLPPNLSGVRKSVPEIHLLHLMANDVFRPHLPPLPAGTHRARDWREAEPLLVELLLGAISAPACPAAPADA